MGELGNMVPRGGKVNSGISKSAAPLRKVVSRVRDRKFWLETLECGHIKLVEEKAEILYRRCYSCKSAEDPRKRGEAKVPNGKIKG